MTQRPLDFASAKEREDWIIQNAQYFTTCRTINRKYERQEHATLELARSHAKNLLAENPIKPILIYAVEGESSVYIEMVKP